MTHRSFAWFVILLLVAMLLLGACNRAAAPDVTEMDGLMSEEAASNAESAVPTPMLTEAPTEEVTEEPTEVVTEEPTEIGRASCRERV